MKKKFITFLLLLVGIVGLTACAKTKVDLNDYLIEDRQNLYTAQDSLYSVTFSTGMREENYTFDGVVNNMVEFGVITFARLDSAPMANDSYTYIVTIGDENYTGFLEKTSNENSYSADIETSTTSTDTVKIQITFTGYNFNQELSCISNEFSLDSATAIDIANKELSEEINNITSDKNNKIEAICKILKDYSNSDIKSYYYYIGILSTNGDTIGILIDANSGEVIAKKV